MAITDLTGYTWVGNETIDVSVGFTYAIDFVSNTTIYNSFKLQEAVPILNEPATLSYLVGVVGPTAYSIDGWEDEAYRTIQITGGTDATNQTLIAWLEANGTLTAPEPEPEPTGTDNIYIGSSAIKDIFIGNTAVSKVYIGNSLVYEKGGGPTPGPITDLTNTTWMMNNTVNVYMLNYTFDLNFTSNNSTFDSFSIVYDIGSDVGSGSGPDNQGLDYYYVNSDSDRVYDARNNTWTNSAYKTITITGGADATNQDLIDWLQANATQQ